MSDRTILAVPGLSSTSPAFRSALWDMAARNGWDVDAIATVMSSESGFNPSARNPYGTATGLIQITEGTAKALGTTTADLATMGSVAQLEYIEKFYRRMGINSNSRPFDYYVVGLGQRPLLPLDYQVVSNENYTVNSGLDWDKDGKITVADMRDVFNARASRAGGRRLDASPLAVAVTPVAPGASVRSLLASRSLLSSCVDTAKLSVLQRDVGGPDVAFWQMFLGGLKIDGWFGPLTQAATMAKQRDLGVKPDGIVGPITWAAARDRS